MTTPPQPGAGPAPAPLPGRPSPLPASEVQQMMRALVVVLQGTTTRAPNPAPVWKFVSEDVINLEPVNADLRPACLVVLDRVRYTENNNDRQRRPWRAEAEIIFDVQGMARSNNGKSLGYNVNAMRNALVQNLLLTLANNRGLLVRLEEFGEAGALQHALDAMVRVEVEHLPVPPPLTRTLVRVTVALMEYLDGRAFEAWTFGVLEGSPLGGEPVEAAAP